MAVTEELIVRAKWKGDDLTRGTKKGAKDLDGLTKATSAAGKAFAALGIGVTVVGLVQMSKALVRTADEWTNITNRIKLFTTSAAETVTVQEQLFQISQKTRASMSATTELFQRLSQANKALRLDQADLQGVLATLNQTLVISGTSAESAKAGLIQLGQAFASGQLRGEELRSVMEQMPRLTQALAAGLDTDVAGLRKFAEAGELTARRVIEAIQSQASVVNKEFAGMEMTVEQASTALANSFGRMVDKLNEVTGATSLLAKAMFNISVSMDAMGIANDDLSLGDLATGALLNISPQLGAQRAAERAVTGSARTPEQAARDSFSLALQYRARRDRISEFGDVRGASRTRLRTERENRVRGADITGRTGGVARTVDLFAKNLTERLFQMSQENIGDLRLQGVSPDTEGLRAGEAALGEARNQLALVNATAHERELLLLDARQQEAMVLAQLGGASEDQIKILAQLQSTQREGVAARQAEQVAEQARRVADSAANRAQRIADSNARAAAFREQQEFNRALMAGVSVLRRLAPEFSNFIGAAASLAQGDTIGAAVQGFHGLLDAFTDANEDYRREIENTRRTLQLASQSARSFAQSLGEEASIELLTLQKEALEPIQKLFDLIQASAPDDSLVEQLEAFFDALRLGTSGRYNVFDPKFTLSNISREFQEALLQTGTTFADFMSLLATAFGHEEARNLQEVGRQIFSVSDALQALFDTADAGTAVLMAAQRAIRLEFDALEIRERQAFREQLAAAGGDPHEQARVFANFRDSVEALRAAEEARLRAAGRGDAPDGGGRGSPDPDPPSPQQQDLDPRPEAPEGRDVFQYYRPIPVIFAVSFDFSGATPVEIQASEAVTIIPSSLTAFEVTGFGQIILWEDIDLIEPTIPWVNALSLVNFTPSRLNVGFGVDSYGGIIDWELGLDKVAPELSWVNALSLANFRPSTIRTGFNVDDYGSMIEWQLGLTKLKPEQSWVTALDLTDFRPSTVRTGFGIDSYGRIIEWQLGLDKVKPDHAWVTALDLGNFRSSTVRTGFRVGSYDDIIEWQLGLSKVKPEQSWVTALDLTGFRPSTVRTGFRIASYANIIDWQLGLDKVKPDHSWVTALSLGNFRPAMVRTGFRVNGYDDIMEWQLGLNKVKPEQSWVTALSLENFRGSLIMSGFRVADYSDIIKWQLGINPIKPIVSWAKALDLTGFTPSWIGPSGFGLVNYSDVITWAGALTKIKPIRDWHVALDIRGFNPSMLADDFLVINYSDVITWSDNLTMLTPITPWSKVADISGFTASPFTDFDVSAWDQVFTVSTLDPILVEPKDMISVVPDRQIILRPDEVLGVSGKFDATELFSADSIQTALVDVFEAAVRDRKFGTVVERGVGG